MSPAPPPKPKSSHAHHPNYISLSSQRRVCCVTTSGLLRHIMESSPVVKAHDHAHAAAAATRQSSDTTVAISEHTQAAGEFANAANTTSSVEALRTLRLLEEHHRRLAALLDMNIPQEQSLQTADDEKNVDEKMHDDPKKRAPRGQVPGLTQRRSTSREMSSSIASNLASARGIRSRYTRQPLSPSVSSDQAPGNVDPHPRRDGSRSKMQTIMDTSQPSWVPPGAKAKPDPSPRLPQPPPDDEDAGYTRFYNSFGSLLNKISAPLAFAGLPLIQEEPSASQASLEPEPAPAKRKSRPPPPTSVSLDPDLSKIYSKATMRALAREGHNPNESFYVVPTSGHTMSYANILSYAEKEKRRLGTEADQIDEDDDFVDASETPVPLSPGAIRRPGLSKTERGLRNTIEELSMENKSLKDMLDNVSKRLHAFEASSQHSAMALAESYRIMRPGSPSAARSGADVDDTLRRRTTDVEEQLASATKQMERLEKDNRKMQKTLDKYREKWEVLKAGAKARREGKADE